MKSQLIFELDKNWCTISRRSINSSTAFTFVQGVYLQTGLGARAQGPLGPLCRRPEPPQGSGVGPQVLVVLLLELFCEVVDEAVVEVLATEVGVSGSCLHLEQGAFVDGQDGDVEGATTQVEDQDLAFSGEVFVQAVGQGGGRGLVYDAQDVDACEEERVFEVSDIGDWFSLDNF